MDEHDCLVEHFEADRTHLRAVANRMLGSPSEADDAVQEVWLRLSRSDTSEVENLAGWLTTVVGRQEDRTDPEHGALLADSVGLALLVVLQTLSPAERLAFVFHNTFGCPSARSRRSSTSPPRRHASRARRRVRGEIAVPDADLDTQREVVDAFLAASRDGDFEALLEVLIRTSWCEPTGVPLAGRVK